MVDATTVRQGVFAAISALIIANKPTYDHNGTTYTYNLVAEYNRENPTLPCIVLQKSNINISLLTLDAGTQDYMIGITMEFHAKELHGKKAIDIAQDSLLATFLGNISTFISDDKLIPDEDFWADGASVPDETDKQIINDAESTIKFKLG